ncbi:MAG: sporulation protein [Coriobacteriia bacterium]|nr:sporulation protein [Coriobacteriia bacterium]
MATVDQVMEGARDVMTVRRVFGEPVERGGVTFIPVAAVKGGGGGGSGEDPEKGQTGSGAGFGAQARPVGAYVIRGDRVEWQPALDVARLAMGGMVLAGLITLTAKTAIKRRG